MEPGELLERFLIFIKECKHEEVKPREMHLRVGHDWKEGVTIVFNDNIKVFVSLHIGQKECLIFIRSNPLPSLRKITQTSSSWFIPLQTELLPWKIEYAFPLSL